MSQSTTARRRQKDFPLTKRVDGRWQKKCRGKTYYFRGTAQEALAEWNRIKADAYAGHDPRERSEAYTIRDLFNRFLSAKQDAVASGELSQRTWDDYRRACDKIKESIALTRTIESLKADDFTKLRRDFARGRSLVTLSNLILRARVVFKFAEDYELVDRKIRGLATFKRPSKADLRKEKQRNGGEKLFSREEIHKMLAAATPSLKAMILLACNCGLGNTDVAKLTDERIKDRWLDYPRPKTGVNRRAKLWDETLDAIEKAGGLPLRGKYGGALVSDNDNALSKTFRLLLDDVGITRRGVGFYALRHVYRTIADETKDQPAIDLTMGHARDDMASIYRERISDERLEAVAEYVRNWLYS